MHIFKKSYEYGEKINFVDEQNTFVGFEYSRDCCERYGYVFTSKKLTDKEITKLLEAGEAGEIEENEAEFNFDGYVFDKGYFREGDNGEDLHWAQFKLVAAGKPNIYPALYNEHNGYYAHDFDFCQGEIVLKSGNL